MLYNKKILTGTVSIVGSLCMFAGSVGAFSWGKKKNSAPPAPVNEIQNDVEISVELLDAKKKHSEAAQETQDAYSVYQARSIAYKVALAKAMEALENSQQKTAEWAQALAARDFAASVVDNDCVFDGSSQSKYLDLGNKANEKLLEKERVYVTWVSCNQEQKDADKRMREAYDLYIDALTKQRDAFENWIKVSSQQQ